MNVTGNPETFGIGSNPRGGACTLVWMSEDEILELYDLDRELYGIVVIPAERWSHPGLSVVHRSENGVRGRRLSVDWRLVAHPAGDPVDGGPNVEGAEIVRRFRALKAEIEAKAA